MEVSGWGVLCVEVLMGSEMARRVAATRKSGMRAMVAEEFGAWTKVRGG